jgi:glycosyltransferase, family 2
VIIPIYNGEQYIDKCLESITNQYYQNLEILCVINGSTDASEKMVRAWMERDDRVKLLVTSTPTTPAVPSTSATTTAQSKQAPAVKAAPTRKSTAPKTGDADTILAYAATLFMSVIGLGVALFARKKREQ